MSAACRLCNAMIDVPLVLTPQDAAELERMGLPAEITPQMRANAQLIALAQHVAAEHPQHSRLLETSVNEYRTHLYAKLGTSTDPDFEELREKARSIAYWTLRADLEFSNADGTPAGRSGTGIITS